MGSMTRTMGRTSALALAAALCQLRAAGSLSAQTTADEPAAIVIYPHIQVDTSGGIDTAVQLSNSDRTHTVVASCFYQTADRSCSVTSFSVTFTPGQPLRWRAATGLSTFPLDANHRGPDGQTNEGSLIPPVPADPFSGSLLCIAIDGATHLPAPLNIFTGSATIEHVDPLPFDAAAYNAIGIRAVPNAVAGDGPLILGGPAPSYNPCAATLGAAHYFDGALDAATMSRSVSTRLILVPCTQDLKHGFSSDVSVRYEVTNEFEQHLGVGRIKTGCEQAGSLSSIDTVSRERSIFSAAVEGTLTGQTRLYADPDTVGLLAIGIETQADTGDPANTQSAMFSLVTTGIRSAADVIVVPGLAGRPCSGDCNADRQVTIDELLRCVNIALTPALYGSCSICDVDGNGNVTVDEIVTSVSSAFNGCP